MTAPILFQALPPLSPEEYSALEQSIKEYGVQSPIVVDERGVVIDGHHRQKIAEHLGLECPRLVRDDLDDTAKRSLALSLNIDRRHLTREQKRALVVESLKADPQLSDRQHAVRTGVSHPTVAAIRAPLEATGKIYQSAQRESADGRQRPATQSLRVVSAGSGLREALRRPVAEADALAEAIAPAEPSAPAEPMSSPVQPGRPRRPLPDAFFDAAFDLGKAVDRVVRLTGDDRFPRNADQVAAKHRSDLIRARDALQGVLEQLP